MMRLVILSIHSYFKNYTASTAVQDIGVIVITLAGCVHVVLQWCSRQYIARRTASRYHSESVLA